MITYRGYYIKPHKIVPTNYVIVTEGRGGKIPDSMRGLFTSINEAKRVVDFYSERKTNASKTRAKSGD